MPTATDRAVENALELPADERIGLVDRILASEYPAEVCAMKFYFHPHADAELDEAIPCHQ